MDQARAISDAKGFIREMDPLPIESQPLPDEIVGALIVQTRFCLEQLAAHPKPPWGNLKGLSLAVRDCLSLLSPSRPI